MKILLFTIVPFAVFFIGCRSTQAENRDTSIEIVYKNKKQVSDIKMPAGFESKEKSAFASYLKGIDLKADKKVYLYNGHLKANQDAQYAVLNISVGNKDLQQCADAIMRLRAEYLFEQKRYTEIEFKTASGTNLNFDKWLKGIRYRLKGNNLIAYYVSPQQNIRKAFDSYLEFVFSYCGTSSLPASLKKKQLKDIKSGDVFLKPGSPGHAVIVLTTAVSDKGKKIYLLAQSYMPAQSIHVLKNPSNQGLSPWYEVTIAPDIQTPEWTFYPDQLYEWEKF